MFRRIIGAKKIARTVTGQCVCVGGVTLIFLSRPVRRARHRTIVTRVIPNRIFQSRAIACWTLEIPARAHEFVLCTIRRPCRRRVTRTRIGRSIFETTR